MCYKYLDEEVVGLDGALGGEVQELEHVDHDVCEGAAQTRGLDVREVPGPGAISSRCEQPNSATQDIKAIHAHRVAGTTGRHRTSRHHIPIEWLVPRDLRLGRKVSRRENLKANLLQHLRRQSQGRQRGPVPWLGRQTVRPVPGRHGQWWTDPGFRRLPDGQHALTDRQTEG